MKYRQFGKLDWKVSALAFGAMRLTLLNSSDPSSIDEPLAIQMMRYAIDHGVNYVDTAYGYHGGRSEVIVGKALHDGYREKIKLATKMPSWMVDSPQAFDRLLNEQLKKLQTGKVDFYLLHGLNDTNWPKVRDFGVLKWAEGAMTDGRIGHLGFSFHDTFDVLKEIIDAYDNWAVCQVQYNYMDEKTQAGTRGLKYAHSKGLATVIMEPVGGGRLARPTEAVAKVWADAPQKGTPAEWALRWVWNHPEVSTVLSGMTTMPQVVENIASAEHSQPHNLTADELALIGRVRDAYRAQEPIPCTNCKYCMPCPNGVEIPLIFGLYNDAVIYNIPQMSRNRYSGVASLKEEKRGDKCLRCGECMKKCPQSIPIPDWLEKAHAYLMPPKA